jgi:hypothetical protein
MATVRSGMSIICLTADWYALGPRSFEVEVQRSLACYLADGLEDDRRELPNPKSCDGLDDSTRSGLEHGEA